MKKLKKALIVSLLLLLMLSTNCLAALASNVTFSVVDETKCEMNFGENGEFLKHLVSYDKESVTLELKVTNNATESTRKNSPEIMLVLDNSLSLETDPIVDNQNRKDLVYNSAKALVSKLYASDPDFKVGVVSFSSCTLSTNTPFNPNEGSIADATLKQTLTTSSEDVLSAINSIYTSTCGNHTNMEAGLELARQNFSNSDVKKYAILISDGIPNNDLAGHTIEYSDEVMQNTKNKLKQLADEGINIISVLTGIEDVSPDGIAPHYPVLAETIFGTTTNPNFGKYYYITDTKIKKIVEENVFSDIETVPGEKLTNIKITDYFPQKIVDNFDFAYITSPTHGNISTSINKTNNSITWTIPELNAGETATIQYKLTLKENFDHSIADEIIPTNEKVNITDDQGDDVTSPDSPKVKITITPEPTPEKEPDVPKEEPKDPTIVPTPQLPQTGSSNVVIISLALISGFAIYEFIKMKRIK